MRISLLIMAFLSVIVSAAPIKRFIGIDESRAQLIVVDTEHNENTWAVKLPERCRDYQLVGNQQLLLNGSRGYYIYDLTTHKQLKVFANDAFKGCMAARRMPNGHTILGCLQGAGTVVYELNADDTVLKKAEFPNRRSLRLLRLGPDGTFFFGGPEDTMVEATMDGKVIRETKIPGGKHVYQGLRLPNGNLIVSSGYGKAICEFTPDGKEIRRITVSAEDQKRGVAPGFFAGMQLLPDGAIAVTNWTGHRPEDSKKAPQLLLFDKDGKLVYTWHDDVLAGCLHGVIVLDNLSTALPANEQHAILQNIPQP